MKKQYYVLNGPNINMLGIREPEHYGSDNYSTLVNEVKKSAKALGVKTKVFQSNHEGDLVDKIQEAHRKGVSGIIINPGAYTHTSIAILDAIKSVKIPTVEVHISKLEDREDFRQISYISLAAEKRITGHGISGYSEALEYLANK